LIDEVVAEIRRLNEENFRVRQHIPYVHKFQNREAWNCLTAMDVNEIKEHIAPLIVPLNDDELAKRFDLLMYTVELAKLQTKNATKPIRSMIRTTEALSKLGSIPQVQEQKCIIEKV
jgi:type I site-specific restriction endonuclease